MNCPMCGATYTIVTYQNPTKGDSVDRRRKCPECKHAFTTVELYVEEYERLKLRSANFETLVSQESRDLARKVMKNHGR
mgnify:FL=1